MSSSPRSGKRKTGRHPPASCLSGTEFVSTPASDICAPVTRTRGSAKSTTVGACGKMQDRSLGESFPVFNVVSHGNDADLPLGVLRGGSRGTDAKEIFG